MTDYLNDHPGGGERPIVIFPTIFCCFSFSSLSSFPNFFSSSHFLLSLYHSGAEIILEFAGKDATAMFEDIGHSGDARNMMKKFLKGDLKVLSHFSVLPSSMPSALPVAHQVSLSMPSSC